MSTPADDDIIGQWELVHAATEVTHRQLLRRLERTGVPSAWFTVLRLLLAADDNRLPMSTLAREVAMTTGGFTKLADRMAREGMIDRRGSSGDRRVVYATLTDAGVAAAQQAVAEFGAALRDHVLSVITAKQLHDISAAMQQLQDAHGDSRPKRPEVDTQRPRLSPSPTSHGERRGRA